MLIKMIHTHSHTLAPRTDL